MYTISELHALLHDGKTLVFDLDGTVNNFYEQSDCLLRSLDPGFYLQLKPYERGLKILNLLLHQYGPSHIFTCTSSPTKNTDMEKYYWQKVYIPLLPKSHMSIIRYGLDKYTAIEKIVPSEPVLIDDHTPNCQKWVAKGHMAIKAVNKSNCKNGSWKGPFIKMV